MNVWFWWRFHVRYAWQDRRGHDDGDTTLEYMKDTFAFPILQAIETNMESYGWNRVGVEDSPDVLLTPAGIKFTTYL